MEDHDIDTTPVRVAPAAPVRQPRLAATAGLFVPHGADFARWRDTCAAHAHNRGYAIVAIATTWDAAQAMLTAGEAVVAVVGRRDHLPADRLPRLEVVNEQPASLDPRRRRPVRRR
jgi:hypothetical protein